MKYTLRQIFTAVVPCIEVHTVSPQGTPMFLARSVRSFVLGERRWNQKPHPFPSEESARIAWEQCFDKWGGMLPEFRDAHGVAPLHGAPAKSGKGKRK